MFPTRLTDDVTLELLEVRHSDELFRVTDSNRAHLRQWLPWVDGSKGPEDTKAFIQLTRKQLLDNNGFQTAIRCRGEIVGVVGHHSVNWANRTTSLGYWLSRDAQGRGIMTEACRMYTGHAFVMWNLNRVEIRCAVENRRSRAIPERLGFQSEGTIREAEWLYDHFVDHVVYSMLASDWSAGASSERTG
jgi:ribosomal-protein-serine acetyltransferase